jgi:hypothetical protein
MPDHLKNIGHRLPFGFDWHLKEKPTKWVLNENLILQDPKKSHAKMVRKYWKALGEDMLGKEVEVFKKIAD